MKTEFNLKERSVSDEEKLQIERAIIFLKSLSHSLRRSILDVIKDAGEINVTDIYQCLELDQTVCSQQLAVLRRADVVITKRRGKEILYSVNVEKVEHIINLARQF